LIEREISIGQDTTANEMLNFIGLCFVTIGALGAIFCAPAKGFSSAEKFLTKFLTKARATKKPHKAAFGKSLI
jgi:hypothetical protein